MKDSRQETKSIRGEKKGIPANLNRTALFVACIHWIITFFTDRLIFSYVVWDLSSTVQTVKTVMTYGAKAVFLVVLIGLYQGLYYFLFKADRRFVRYTLLYFALHCVLLTLTWPGIWRMDEFGILNSAVLLLPVFWQNYLTSLFYVFSLMLFPVPSGVILVQGALVSCIVGYIVLFFVKRFGKWGLFSFMPFLFFPVLDSNLYPMRMSLYGFLELFLVFLVLDKWEAIRKDKNAAMQLGKGSLIKCWGSLCILAALVTVWRTEAVYYFLLFPCLLFLLFRIFCKKNRLEKRRVASISCFYLVLAFCLFVPQTVGDTLTSGSQYDLTSVVLPLVPLVDRAYDDPECEELLADIDRVVDVDMIKEGVKEGKSGINLFWGEPDFQRDYTDEEYGAFKSAYYGLVLKFPDTFLKERWDCFVHSVDLLQNTTELFSAEGVPNYDRFREYPGSRPVSEILRNDTIRFLEWKSAEDYEVKKAGYAVVYSHLIPILILFFAWAGCFVRKKWGWFFTLSLPLVKVPLIFLTAPSRLFMYYYSLYLIGYVVLCYGVCKTLALFWDRAGGNVKKTIAYAKRNGIKETWFAIRERTDKSHMDPLALKAASYEGCKDWSIALPSDESKKEEKKQRERKFAYAPLISILVPAYETGEDFLKELLESVYGQTYSNWELIIADGGKSHVVENAVKEFCAAHENTDAIRYIRLSENKGISENTNAALDQAGGEYIALLDHDDLLTKDALFYMVEKLNEYGKGKSKEDLLPAAVYSDEDKCDGRGQRFYEPHFKPDFDMELLLTNNYVCHFLMVEANLMKELKLRKEFDGAQDYDLILRLGSRNRGTKVCGPILHVDKVLYHWRCHEDSTASNTESKRYAYEAGKRALIDFYKEAGMKDQVKVEDSVHLGFYTTEYLPDVFSVREDVAAVCGRVVKKGMVIGGPDFIGLRKDSSGYMHRAALRFRAKTWDERALKVRPDLGMSLEEAVEKGMKVLYDPTWVVEI
ncbi:MAG: glycosyltransferase [Lachnospiraceae bacterium]|nr:glycosyltransferase [Lachnospiraceae bacterium]